MSAIDGGNVEIAAEPVESTSKRRPRRRRIVMAVSVVLVLFVAVTAGIGYYFSSELLEVDNAISYPIEVKAVNGDQVTLSRDSNSERAVRQGLRWDGGAVLLSGEVTVNADSVVRTVTSRLYGALAAGLHATMDIRMYDRDPSAARGLRFDPVAVTGELGDMPAWFVAPTSPTAGTTWVIAVHGLRGTLAEPLRVLPTLAAKGYPTLIISYRNDPHAPHSPDGYYHLGDSEWRDVSAAIGYAKAHGASGVVLYGWSMGGTLTVTALRRMPAEDLALVRGVVLDCPAIDWTTILDRQGAQRGLPGFITWTAQRLVELRGGFSLTDIDGRPYAPQLTVPMLIYVDTADDLVPNGPTLQFAAAARPGMVTLVKTAGGGHTGSWNVDPQAYEATLTGFLSRLTTAK